MFSPSSVNLQPFKFGQRNEVPLQICNRRHICRSSDWPAIMQLNFFCSKEAETGAILFALMKIRERGFLKCMFFLMLLK